MKLLFFLECLSSNGSIGGAEKVLSTLVNHLDKNQFDITVQTVFPDPAADLLDSSVHYRFLFSRENRFTRLLYRVETAIGLSYRLHMRGEYDIEAAYLEFGPTKVIARSNNKKARKMAWVHCDFETAIRDKAAFRNKTERYYQAIDQIICVSEKAKESFCTIFGQKQKVSVVYNVIDSEEIREKSEHPIPSQISKKKTTLLMVGRFMTQKNYPRLLKTADRLHRDGFDFDLWIVGDGPEREKIEEYIKQHRMKEYVFLLGFQKNPYPYMKAADLLVCSSNYEGYSTFITEGLILGKPILTTDCSGMHELLGDSEYGIIVKNDDEAFYNGIKAVLSDYNSVIPVLQEKARQRSVDFELAKLVQDTELFLKNVVEQDT